MCRKREEDSKSNKQIIAKVLSLTYYYLAASSFNTPLERRAPNERLTTVLNYHTVLIKEISNGDKQCIPVLNRELCLMSTQTIQSMD